MISRRTILKWLGFAAAAPVLPAMAEIAGRVIGPAVRSRKAWQTVLEADGSTSWVNDQGKRFLDAWLESGEFDEWGKEAKNKQIDKYWDSRLGYNGTMGKAEAPRLEFPRPTYDDVKATIEADKEALKWRSRWGQCFNEEDHTAYRKEKIRQGQDPDLFSSNTDAMPTGVDGKPVSQIAPLTDDTFRPSARDPDYWKRFMCPDTKGFVFHPMYSWGVNEEQMRSSFLKGVIEADNKDREERIDHWRHFKEFQTAPGVTVKAEFTSPGAVLRNDPKETRLHGRVVQFPHNDTAPDKKWDLPVFHYTKSAGVA
jgi:hypothetical protein